MAGDSSENRAMRGSRLLIGLLVLATVAVDGVVLVSVGIQRWVPPVWPHPTLGLLFALAFSQVSLMAIWLGLGQRPSPWRLVGMVLTVAAWSGALPWVLRSGPPFHTATPWAIMLLGLGLLIAIGVAIARTLGVRLVEIDAPAEPSGDGLGPRQFSLGYLLAWMTAVPVVLGTLQYMVPGELLGDAVQRSLRLDVVLINGGLAITALACLAAMLGAGSPICRSILLLVSVAVVIAVVIPLATPVAQRTLILMNLSHVLLLAGSLGVVRIAGYRLVRERSPSRSEE